jgi:hypothetical protein
MNMPYRLNKGVYSVRCRHSNCPFHARLEIGETIMGVTENDVKVEAIKMAGDMARVRHDSIHGRQHQLKNPEIRMASGNIQLVGTSAEPIPPRPEDCTVKEFMKGDVILKKGENATYVCEVLGGAAYPPRNRRHRYSLGDCFGVAALLPNHSRTIDVVAASDRTRIAFYQLPSLTKHDPQKASRIFNRVLEDTLQVMAELGQNAEAAQ